jgi:hypothetical protein
MSTGNVAAFKPILAETVAASTTPASATGLPSADSILVYNAAGATAFVSIGAAATTASTPVPAGGRQLFAAGPLVTSASVVLSSGTGAVYLTAGNGTAW